MAETDNDVVLPRFFKVFLSETASESMSIPVSFSEHLEDPLPQTVKLQGTGGGIWTVSFKKIRQRAYFTAGWSKFAEDHDLKNGEFLTFVYDGYNTFEVSVYNRWGSKETRAVKETVEISDTESEEEEEAVADSDYEEEEEDPLVDGGEDTESDDAGISQSEVTSMSMTNPYFTTGLKNRIYELLIPAEVVKDMGFRFGESIKYVDEEGTMVGERGKWADDRICFKGWDRICRRNRLRVQDKVNCEMLHHRKLVHSIKIHITRG
ncbi:hypothetical protein EUTSA_v10000999mg [Eutrema salsugineum]|uniref:TF-B3 domain-containing protein n=1 Tax=Eutrema salsugineum TaxID=72664 RepID=V4KNU7_EUTSA|nr:B3 domain-containing protein REM20 [Eutrema salsugineum]ESQ39550.1 hypothetical protein EUTSA_v10000999mg [Eutrema salsugineum]